MPPSLDSEEKKAVEGSSSTTIEEHVISRPTSAHRYPLDEEKQETDVHEDRERHLNPLSTATTESVIPPPPDGGLHAWLKVFGGFFIYVNIWSVQVNCNVLSTPR